MDAAVKGSARRSDAIYDSLRRAIVTGEIRPNQPLIELDLAAKLGVSRTPVRESLQRLVIAGLVVPRKRGWAVREFTAEEMQENAEVRAGLEGYAACLAAERGSDAAIDKIVALHRSRLTLRPGDEQLRLQTNRDFHDAIMQAAGNQRLKDAIYNSGQFYFNGAIARLTIGDELAQGNADHALIVDAIVAHDGPAAERAMRAHIQRTFSVYRRVIQAMPSDR
jgi:DNA-binding GntR family transcriptional regulator